MSKALNTFTGFLIGVLLGVGLVLLFTPQSGANTQQLIRARIDEVLEAGRQEAEARRRELTSQFEALKQPKA